MKMQKKGNHTKDKDQIHNTDINIKKNTSFLETGDSINEKTYYQAKKRLNYLKDKYHNNKSIFALTVTYIVIAGIVIAIFFYYCFQKAFRVDLVYSIVLSIAAGAFFTILLLLYLRVSRESRISKYERIILEYEVNNNIIEEVKQKVDEDIYENLIKISYTYLDQYYLLVREQAQKSFFITLGISIVGAILVIIGIISMLFGLIEPSYISAGAGVLTEFISAVFFYLYNRTVISMSRYHNKLVLSQNISLAIKIVDSMPESEQSKVKESIITELLKDINSYLISKEDSKN